MAIRALILLASVLLMAGLAACGGGADEPAPTATQVPPTSTPMPSDGDSAEPTETTVVEPTEAPSLMVGFEVGEMAPDFELTTIDGEQLSLSDFRGDSPVLLYFFATW